MRFDDVQDCGKVLIVRIPDSKTHQERKFTVMDDGFGIHPIDLYQRYISFRPKNSPPRLFIHYYKGKCSRQNVRVNTFRAIPRRMATFLKLENPARHTLGIRFVAAQRLF